jgi:hypothetical protein
MRSEHPAGHQRAIIAGGESKTTEQGSATSILGAIPK